MAPMLINQQLNYIIISNYLLILPHHHHLGGIPSIYAIIINNIGMISLLPIIGTIGPALKIGYGMLSKPEDEEGEGEEDEYYEEGEEEYYDDEYENDEYYE